MLMSVSAMMPLGSAAAGDTFEFSYNYEGAELTNYGIQRNVPIDAAMLVKNQTLVGSKIIGVSIDIPTFYDCTCDPVASAWLTSKLQVDGEYNVPDIIETQGEIRNYGTEDAPELRLDITFDRPYTMTAEGVYVGYSLLVTNCKIPTGYTSKYPLVLVCNIDQPQGFMIHTRQGDWTSLPNKYPEWTDLGAANRQALAMRVLLSGETHDAAATLEFQQGLYAAPGTTGNVYTTLTNAGSTPISSIAYTYTVGEREITNEFTVSPPLAGQSGANVTLDLPFEVPAETGDYVADVRLTKVNGVDNGYTGTTGLNVGVVPFLPENRPLISEYAGLWCGNCPSAYVAIRQLQDKYGEELLSISYHTGDQIQSVPTADFPNMYAGLPALFLNRQEINAGTDKVEAEAIEYPWLRARRELAPADIDATLFWEDNSRNSVIAEAHFKFVYDNPDADYRIAYALVEDDMSDSLWGQRNFYTGNNYEGAYWDLFCGKPFVVTGIVYDDVVISFPNPKGIENSVPTNIRGGVSYTHRGTLAFKDAVCVDASNAGKSLIKDRGKIRVVVLLIDNKTGLVCNSATTGYTADAKVFGTVGVGGMSDIEVQSTEYVTLDGIRSAAEPEKGCFIVIEHLSDGTLRTRKVIL